MKKGFTLVEMLVILIFLSVIALMAIPSITNMIKKGTDDKYNVFLNDVFLATEAYLQKHADDYPYLNTEGLNTYIYMSDLVDEKYISTSLVNPKYCIDDECTSKAIAVCSNDNCIVDDYTIIVTKDEDGKYKYRLLNRLPEACEYELNEVVFDKDYSGSVDTFTPKCNGMYRLEVWGAQGGNGSIEQHSISVEGGYGAYAIGTIELTKNKDLYVVIGGQGVEGTMDGTSTRYAGGYNGGGYGYEKNANVITSGGGGATHISLKTGLLSTLSNDLDSILIAAAGGSGGYAYYSSTKTNTFWNGNSGGGVIGGYSFDKTNAATQTTGYSFGQASDTEDTYLTTSNHSGGGGGLYGGFSSWGEKGSGGGSSYIGNDLLFDKKVYCYQCEESNESSTKTIATTEKSTDAIKNYAKIGSGHARITYLGI